MPPEGMPDSTPPPPEARVRGTAPRLGKVTRVERRTRQRSVARRNGVMRGGDAREVIFIRCTIFLLVLLAVTGVALVVSRETDDEGRVRMESGESRKPEYPPLGEERAVALVQAALEMRDPERAMERFHLGAGGALELRQFLQSLAKTAGEVDGYEWLGSRDANHQATEVVRVNFRKDLVRTTRLALITPDGRGVWKIDHDAFARKVEPGWAEIMGGRTDPSIVRVVLTPARVFEAPFSGDGTWDCYAMDSPDLEVTLYGYCRTGTRRAAALMAMAMQGDGPGFRATLQIEAVAGERGRRFEILRALAEDWVMGAKAYDVLSK